MSSQETSIMPPAAPQSILSRAPDRTGSHSTRSRLVTRRPPFPELLQRHPGVYSPYVLFLISHGIQTLIVNAFCHPVHGQVLISRLRTDDHWQPTCRRTRLHSRPSPHPKGPWSMVPTTEQLRRRLVFGTRRALHPTSRRVVLSRSYLRHSPSHCPASYSTTLSLGVPMM